MLLQQMRITLRSVNLATLVPGATFALSCRYVKPPDTVSDPAFANYHACAPLPTGALRTLNTPGAMSATWQVDLDKSFSQAAERETNVGSQLTSRLPPPPAPGAKAKPCEAALMPADDGSVCCGWHGGSFQLQLQLTNPIVPPWKPPPKLAKSLADIVPPRQIDKLAAEETATHQFKTLVSGAAGTLFVCCALQEQTGSVLSWKWCVVSCVLHGGNAPLASSPNVLLRSHRTKIMQLFLACRSGA